MFLTITHGIILITSIVSWISFNNYSIKNKLILSPSRVLNKKEIWLLFTHAFIHADFLHLFFNMYVLYMFGPYLEFYFTNHAAFGEFTFLIFYYWLWYLIPVIPFIIYPFAWTGHFLFEKNINV